MVFSGVECDLNVNNAVGIRNTHLLNSYSKRKSSFTFKSKVGSVGSVSAYRTVGRQFASRPGHTKDHHKKWCKLPPCIGTHALG